MLITIFKELFKTDIPYHIPVAKAIERIKNGKSKDTVIKVRAGNSELKKKLPCIIFSGTFSQRNSKSLIAHSGLMVLDFDKVDKPENFKKTLTKNNHFYLLFISPSGNGVKGVVKIPPCSGTEHEKIFRQFIKDFDFKFVDASGCNVDRVCFESYDPEIYINEKSVIYTPNIIDAGFKVCEKVPLLPITDEDEIITRIMNFKWSKSFKEGERNGYVFDLAGAFCEYGIAENYAINFIKNHINNGSLKDSECEKSIKSAYKLRNFGSKYFEDYQRKNVIIKDLKYPKKEVIEKHKISAATFDEISKEHEVIDFWFINKKQEIKIDPFKYKLFLESHGFRKYFPEGTLKPQMVKVNSNKVQDTSAEIIKDFVLEWLMKNNEFDVWKRVVNFQNLFSEQYLNFLETIELLMLRDTKEKSFIAFKNGIAEVTADKITMVDYIDVDGYIWHKSIINRDFKKGKTDNDFKKFISNISRNEPLPIECVIGYLLCGYKNKMNNKAVILNDEVISENPEGGTGKGLFVQGIAQMKKTAVLDGKEFDEKKSFPYQTVSIDTSVLVFDDVKKNFNFESKFCLVTEGLTLERKNKDAIKLSVEESPKMVVTTNYAIRGEGNSHDRRRHEIEFSQHYNGKNTPIDEFGRQLFDDWDESEFTRFDNYMLSCLQLYLKSGLVSQSAKNLKLRKFVAETSMEFYEWASDKDILHLDSRNEKGEYFDKFITEYADFKKFLSRKRFNIWLQKYAAFKGYEYEEGNTLGSRWFYLKTNEIKIEDEKPF